jgi:hypothetical protein
MPITRPFRQETLQRLPWSARENLKHRPERWVVDLDFRAAFGDIQRRTSSGRESPLGCHPRILFGLSGGQDEIFPNSPPAENFAVPRSIPVFPRQADNFKARELAAPCRLPHSLTRNRGASGELSTFCEGVTDKLEYRTYRSDRHRGWAQGKTRLTLLLRRQHNLQFAFRLR